MSYTPITLTASVTVGTDINSLAVTALPTVVNSGDIVTVVTGFDSQTFVATGNTIGSFFINVQPQVAAFTFPAGSVVVDQTSNPGPQITPTNASPDTLTLWDFLPSFLQQQDSLNNYTFLSWLEGIGSQQQIIDILVRDNPTSVGWSIILDVTRCPTYALPWLAQFVGLRFSGDILANPAAMRAAIQNPGSWTRGTLATIQAAAGSAVTIVERYPDPYSFTVIVNASVSILTYGLLDATYATYAIVDSTFPTYADMIPTSTLEEVEAAVIPQTPGGLVPIFILA